MAEKNNNVKEVTTKEQIKPVTCKLCKGKKTIKKEVSERTYFHTKGVKQVEVPCPKCQGNE